VEEGLALGRATREIARAAIFGHLSQMPPDRQPPLYLPLIIFASATQVVAAIPLEPAMRILFVDPTLFLPNRERLAGSHFEKIEFIVLLSIFRKLHSLKPVLRQISGDQPFDSDEVSTPKDSDLEHLFGREIRLESFVKIFADRFSQKVFVIFLKIIAICNLFFILFCDQIPSQD
jgi:hypothetical protein